MRAGQDEALTLDSLIESVELERSKSRNVFATQHERFIDRLVQRVRDTKDEITKKLVAQQLAGFAKFIERVKT